MHGNRIAYLDISKGILILFVIWAHVCFYFGDILANPQGFCLFVQKTIPYVFLPYVMPAFFVLHGFYSTPKTSFKEVCTYGLLSLLLPSTMIMGDISFWFTWAMFFALVLDFFFSKLSCSFLKAFLYLFLVPEVGIFLYFHGCNFMYGAYALALLPFLYIGRYLSRILLSKKFGFFCLIAYLICILFFVCKSSFPPYLTGIGLFNFSYISLPVFLILATSGSGALFFISRIVKKNSFLEYIGKNSLLICLIHKSIFAHVSRHFGLDNLLNGINNITISIVVYISFFVFSVFMSIVICRLIMRYCPWIAGKDIIVSKG